MCRSMVGTTVFASVFVVFSLFIGVSSAFGQALHGVAVDATTGDSIEGLEVALSGDVEQHRRTSFVGLFEFDDLPPGDYEVTLSGRAYEPLQQTIEIEEEKTVRERFELTPILSAGEIENGFEIAVHTSCTVSSWQLEDARVRVERLSGEGGDVEESFNAQTDEFGNAYLPWMQPGVYRITAEKEGWEQVVSDDLSIQYRQEVVMYLKPAYGDLTVHVEGWDPRQGEEQLNSDLSDVTVELTGVHPVTHHPLVTPRTDLSNEEGRVDFHRLPPVSWKIRATKLGYEPVEEIIDTIPSGSSEVSLELPSAETAIALQITDPFPEAAELVADVGADGRDAPSPIRIVGAAGTGAEGVELTASPFDWDGGIPDEMIFEGLLPGRYEIHFGASAGYETDSEEWNRPDVAMDRPVVSFSASWFETVEIAHGEQAALTVEPEIEPAVVRGQLQVGRLLPTEHPLPHEPSGLRDDRSRSGPGQPVDLHFVASSMGELHPSGTEIVTTTDDDGYFSVELPPGYWGIEIPGMPGYGGYEYEAAVLWENELRLLLRDRSSFFEPPSVWYQRGIWPVAEPWDVDSDFLQTDYSSDYMSFGFARKPAALNTWSGAEIEFRTLDVVPSTIDVSLPMYRTPWPIPWRPHIDGQIYVGYSSGFSSLIPGDLFHLLGPQTVVDGVPMEVLREYSDYRLGNTFLPAILRFDGGGHRTITVDHPLYECDSRDFDIAMQEYPGVVPADQSTGKYLSGGLTLEGLNLRRFLEFDTSNLRCTYSELEEIEDRDPSDIPGVEVHEWDEDCDDGAGCYGPGTAAGYTVHDDLPDILWGVNASVALGLADGKTGTVWLAEHESGQWAKLSVSVGETVDAYIGGPNNSFTHASPAPDETMVTIRSFTGDGELEGITVDNDGTEVTTPVTFSTSEPSTSVSTADAAWHIRSQKSSVTWDPPAIEITAFVGRNTVLSGTIVDELDNALQESTIEVRDGRGGSVDGFLSEVDQSGNWEFGVNLPSSAGYSTLFVEVSKPGYLPQRIRIDLADYDEGDIGGIDFVLKRPPLPEVDSTSIDRAGLFLPGVRKAGASDNFGPTDAIDALTATWQVTAPTQEATVQLAPYPHHDGDSDVQTIHDRASDVWLIDRRRFRSGFLATDDGDIEEISFPEAPDLRELREFLEGLPGDEVLRSQGVEIEEGVFEGELELWKMPPGDFDPVVLVISQLGAVDFFDFELEQPELQLEGADMPAWASHFLTMLGTAAHFGDEVKYHDLMPKDSLVPGVNFSGAIAQHEEDDRYLTYNYGLGATLALKSETPTQGLVAAGAESMGLSSGVSINFGLDGKFREATLGGSGTLGTEEARKRRQGMPAVVRRMPGTPTLTINTSVGASIEVAERLGAADEAIPDFSLTRSISGDHKTQVAFPLGRAVALLGPLGAIVSSAGSILADIDLVLATLVGGTLTNTMRTTSPRSAAGGTVVEGEEHPPRRNFLGVETEDTTEFQLRFGASGGLAAKTTGGALTGVGQLQLGAPVGGGDGVAMHFNNQALWPLITRAVGAVSFRMTLTVKLLGVSINRSWQRDLLDFDLQLNTEPFVDVPQGSVETFVETPMTAAPSEFVDRDQVLVENFYTAGAFDGVADEQGGLIYTATEPADGVIHLVFAHRGDDGGLEMPQSVAAADGVVDVAAAATPEGLVVVWSEVAAEDLGNPVADTTLRYSTFDGGGWSQAQTLAAVDGVASGLMATSTDDGAVVVWQRAIGHALSERAVVEAAHIDSGDFSETVELYGPAELVDVDAGTTDDEALIAIASQGGVEILTFDEGGESSTQFVTDIPAAALAWDKTGGDLDLWMVAEGTLLRFEGADDFEVAEVVLEDVFARSLLAAQGRFVAWTANDETDALWYATIDADGNAEDEPVRIGAGSGPGFFEAVIGSAVESDGVEVWARRKLGDRDQLVSFELRDDGEPVAPEAVDIEGWEVPDVWQGPDDGVEDPDGEGPDDEDGPDGEEAGDRDSDAEPDADDDGGGCVCASSRSHPSTLLLILAGVVLLVLRRRRYRYSEPRQNPAL